jgi:cytochrome c biogenesis protein CcmG, thiol:disulfide interchange protein DsbE
MCALPCDVVLDVITTPMATPHVESPALPAAGPARRAPAGWRSLALAGLLGVAIVAVNVAYKATPDRNQIATEAKRQSAPARWSGRLAPDVELPTLDGGRFRLADDVGRRVIILNFFATWCGPCRAEMPELERYQREAGDTVRLIGVDAQEHADLVRGFIQQVKTTFPIVVDADGAVLRRYGVEAFPTTVVIGANGRIILYEVGMVANADVSLRPIVERERAAIAAGRGITTEAWRAAHAAGAAAAPPLTRAERIAAAMPCPCGCADKTVAACECRTAKGIKARLNPGGLGFDGLSDAQVMEALNREFCMKGM